jgi:phosphatidate cytidylyltransferase
MAGARLPDGEPVATTVQMAKGHSDLGVRIASALVMLVVAGVALGTGGLVLDGFIAVVGLVTYTEMVLLLRRTGLHGASLAGAMLAGACYLGLGAAALMGLPTPVLVLALGVVIATDTGAYFAGRSIGGPKVAPRISPSKTWAGVFGGMVAAGLWVAVAVSGLRFALSGLGGQPPSLPEALSWVQVGTAFAVGAGLAIAAQSGDFFESWLKRRAGVKDSSRLIPGHGGVFDRIDGLVPVAILVGLLWQLRL